MKKEHGARLVDSVYDSIKDDICTGRLEPGQRVPMAALCKDNNASLSVVREAMTRLASERLLKMVPQQGFTVWPLSIADLLDLTSVRIHIETKALAMSFAAGDVAWEAEVMGAHHRMVASVDSAEPDHPNYAWMKAHGEFHAALAAACGSPLLIELRQQLFEASELYRYWSVALAKPERTRIRKEHQELVNAALAHDAVRGVELISHHIQRTADLIVEARGGVERVNSTSVEI